MNGKRNREQRFSDHNDNMSPRENGHLVSYGHRYGRIAVAGLRGHARVDFSVVNTGRDPVESVLKESWRSVLNIEAV